MATKVEVIIECDKCHEVITDETDQVSLRITRQDQPAEVLEIDLHNDCTDTIYLPDEVVARTKRKRRTRAEMEADMASGGRTAPDADSGYVEQPDPDDEAAERHTPRKDSQSA